MKNTQKLPFLIGAFLLSCAATFLSGKSNIDNKNIFSESSTTQQEKQNQDNYIVSYSYTEVLKNYYEKANAELAENNVKIIFSFEEFCNNYYESGLDFITYYNNCIDNALAFSKIERKCNSITGSIIDSLVDEDYILFGEYDRDEYPNVYSYDYEYVPSYAFRRPLYYTFQYTDISAGDIIIETKTQPKADEIPINPIKMGNIGHTGFIYNPIRQTTINTGLGNDGKRFIQTIDCIGSGVVYGFLDDVRMIDFGVVILRPKEIVDYNPRYSTLQFDPRLKACEFMKAQLGKPYTNIVATIFGGGFCSLHDDINTEKWYCSELIWAAYKYAQINICDPVFIGSDPNNMSHYCVWPKHLLESNKLQVVNCFIYPKIKSLVFEENNRISAWFEVENPTDTPIDVYFTLNSVDEKQAKTAYQPNVFDGHVSVTGRNSTLIRYQFVGMVDEYFSFYYVKYGKKFISYCSNFTNSFTSMPMSVQSNIINEDYIYPSLSESTSGQLKIELFNLSNTTRNVYYKTALISESDAKNFSGNSNINSVYIPSQSYTTITINKNNNGWFSLYYSDGNQLKISYGIECILYPNDGETADRFMRQVSVRYNVESINIVESISMSTSQRYFEKVTSLNSGQSVEYRVTFKSPGIKIIQTFGNEDTIMKLYDNYNNLIKSDDDNGYNYNAYIRYNVSANVQYKIKVCFYNQSLRSNFKFTITPVSNGLDCYGSFSSIESEFVSGSYLSFCIPISKSCVRPFIITVNTTGTYELTTGCSGNTIDTFLYVIETNVTSAALSNDDGAGNLQAKITTTLTKSKNYYVIPCLYNINNDYKDYLELNIAKK